MSDRTVPALMTVLVFVALSAVALAQGDPAQQTPPRGSNGRPDLQGVWNFASATPLQRPQRLADKAFFTQEEAAELAARAASRRPWDAPPPDGSVGAYNQFWWDRGLPVADRRTSLIVDPADGRVPSLTPQAIRQVGSTERHVPGRLPVRYRIGGTGADGPEERGLAARCLMGYNAGPPMLPGGYNNNMQMFQTPDHVVILNEMVHDARVVPLTPRPHLSEDVGLWSGDSRGHWDGDTLVVETTNFSDKKASFEPSAVTALGTGDTLRLIERFTRVDEDTLLYEFTVDDPQTFTRPFTARLPMKRNAEPMFEYACHEGNYGMFNMLTAGRAEDDTRRGTK